MKYIKIIFSLVLMFLLVGCTTNNLPKQVEVTYKVDYTEFKVTLDTGKSLSKPSDPEKDGYKFIGWYNGDILWDFEKDVVNEDLTLTAKFEKVQEEASFAVINLVSESGEVLRTFETSLNEPIPLFRVNKAAKGYNVVGYTYNGKPWDIENDLVKEDMDLVMNLELIKYTISYYDDGKLLEGLEPSEYTVESSASIDLPEAPKKEGYEFIGWFFGTTRVVTFFSSDAENKVYTAKYQKIPTEEDLILKYPDNMTHEFTAINKVAVSDGKSYVYQPSFTGLSVQTGVTNYTWTSLNPDVVSISQWSSMSVVSPGYAVIQAVNNNDKSVVICCVVKATSEGIFISSIEEANTKVVYKVTFLDADGNLIEIQEVEQNKNAILPTPPVKDGYTFVGWDTDHVNIMSDTTIKATYMVGNSNFVGKTVSILGDSISTFKNYVPDGYACFYPYPTADVSDVNYTWWMRTINKLGMKLLKNNSWSGSCVSAGTGVSAAVNDSRLVELTKGTERPDVIFIFMGANDCGSSNVSLSSFQTSYKTMLDKIMILCPESEIYLMTLPTTGLYSEADRIAYNAVIRNYAEIYELPLIDLADLYTTTSYKDHVVDSCHPNNAGMIAISNKIVEELLKQVK